MKKIFNISQIIFSIAIIANLLCVFIFSNTTLTLLSTILTFILAVLI